MSFAVDCFFVGVCFLDQKNCLKIFWKKFSQIFVITWCLKGGA
jgi:hypothetical protein